MKTKKIILIMLVAIYFMFIFNNFVYGYLTNVTGAESNEIEIKFYKGLNTKVSCELLSKNKAKVKLVNNGEIECKAKIKLILPVDVTYTISDSNWTIDGENWINYNNILQVGETVELSIKLNVPSSKDYKFNINVIQETNLVTEYDEPENPIPSNNNGFSLTPEGNILVASIYDGDILIARRTMSDEDKIENWNIATEPLRVGKKYAKNLRVYNPEDATNEQNTKNLRIYNPNVIYEQYARADININLTDEQGNDKSDIMGDAINIDYGDNWLIADAATTMKKQVFVYSKIIGLGEYSTNFISGITINKKILEEKTVTTREENGGTIRTITYDYDGAKLKFEIKVGTVQSSNAADAIWSAWQMKVNVAEDGTLSFAN